MTQFCVFIKIHIIASVSIALSVWVKIHNYVPCSYNIRHIFDINSPSIHTCQKKKKKITIAIKYASSSYAIPT